MRDPDVLCMRGACYVHGEKKMSLSNYEYLTEFQVVNDLKKLSVGGNPTYTPDANWNDFYTLKVFYFDLFNIV